jgi:hypothetical protein
VRIATDKAGVANDDRPFPILVVRGQRVILDADLAGLYGVETRRLNEQLRRNIGRFPSDFAFRLSPTEFQNLMSQIATSSSSWGGRRKQPYAFTEHGAVMAASVLNSAKAIEMSVLVVRAFVRLRRVLVASKQLGLKLQELERKLWTHDREISALFKAIRRLMRPDRKSKRRIGFLAETTSGLAPPLRGRRERT